MADFMDKEDYLMRMIKNMVSFLVNFLAKILLNKDTANYELPAVEKYTQTDYLHKQLLSLINQGKINEAENMLYEELDPKNKKYIELALDFYGRLNNLDDEFLEKNNFPREEIEQGLKAIAKEFGVSIGE
jgi:hypothetical protein